MPVERHAVIGTLIGKGSDPFSALDRGVHFATHGFISDAHACYTQALQASPHDLRALINLANLDRDICAHARCREQYASLLRQHPNHPVIRRNLLTSLEYDPDVCDGTRRQLALQWGQWAAHLAGGPVRRPHIRPLAERPLRVGYVSADFCQHTVGLFVKAVLAAHSQRVTAFAYSGGQVRDWVTEEIRASCQFREISLLDDAAVAALIRNDHIDVLVDLSGHTAGSRLTVFAHRPAPVQVSWLGYFASTGLREIDAVLLDQWHAPPDMDQQFVEPIIRLPGGRFCYQPVPWAPAEVAPPPCVSKGYITFGSYNNTAKLNAQVLAVWSRLLAALPESRLVLKWRTFNDANFCRHILDTFAQHQISADRIELRGPSFHADLLNEYADIDIALDPFPFTGGLTSCEALWMGVPVITWPQSRVVSRQTHAILHQIGLPDLVAQDAEEYLRIAVDLANDRDRLTELRSTLREYMRISPLMDAAGFTQHLEHTLINLYCQITMDSPAETHTKVLLNVGAGHPNNGARRLPFFQSPDWKEVRLDIDAANEPDILGSMLDMTSVANESVDAIYSSHNIEHLYANEIPQAINEFLRVLKPEGYAVIACPDLQAAAQMIAEDKLMEVAYNSPAGPVTPFDMVFSHRMFTGRDNPYMAHHSGFTLKVLMATFKEHGFASVAGLRRQASFELWIVAVKQPLQDEALRELAGRVLPAQ